MKRQGSTELPRFAVGALAIAGASAANGATVQITFVDNYIGLSNGTANFVGDLTGDSAVDVVPWQFGNGAGFAVRALTNVTLGYAVWSAASWINAWLNSAGGNARVSGQRSVNDALVAEGLIGFTFSDESINGGDTTSGWLDMEAVAGANGSQVQIHRLIFDDTSSSAPAVSVGASYPEWSGSTSAVPEASTSLGLLALGAGGLLTRRRLKRAA